jgi:hypothetical protein
MIKFGTLIELFTPINLSLMPTSNNAQINRVSVNIQELIMTMITNTRTLESITRKVRTKIKADLNSLSKGLPEKEKIKLLNLIVITVQGNLNTAGSTAKIGSSEGCLGEGSHGVDYEDADGVYGGICGIGSINGLTGGGIFGGIHY